jgi:restriction system protein
MPIPNYQIIMLPLLKFSADQKEHSLHEAIDALSTQFNLTDEERREMLQSGKQTVFQNRVGWARTYMKAACLLEATRRGYFRITQRGLEVIKQNLPAINARYLERFEEFIQFKAIKKEKVNHSKETEAELEKTPEEILESAYQNLRDNLANDILQQIKSLSE